jgi:RNA polymerase sigma-70 factor, ECF subfamily
MTHVPMGCAGFLAGLCLSSNEMGIPRRHQHDRSGHALAAMYRDHATAAYRYAVHLTGSRQDAEDLVQAAFLEAHRHLFESGAIVNPRAWLATVVRTRASNLRRDRREAAASDQLETLAGALLEDTADAREALDRVRAALYELPEAQHQAFVLRYWSDLSYREIAAVLETTESAVESLLVRARAAIVSGSDVPDECLEVRKRLSADSLSASAHLRHLGDCARCRAARTRLARAAGIAAAVALVPRIHVAQALAATVPGFTAAAATGATATVGAGGMTLAAGKAGIAVKAGVAALVLAGSAALVHADLHPNERAGAPETRTSAPADTSATTATARTVTPSHPANAAQKDPAKRDTEKAAGGKGGDTQDRAQTGDTQGQDASSDGNAQGQDQSTGGDSTSESGDTKAGDVNAQDSNGNEAGSSQDGGSSTGGSGNDNS